MRVDILDDIPGAYEGTDGVRRLCERVEVRIFTAPFGDPSALRGFDALVANRERTGFTRELLEQLPDLGIIAPMPVTSTSQRQTSVALSSRRHRGDIPSVRPSLRSDWRSG